MRKDHLPREARPHHAKRDPLLESSRVTAFKRWTRETFNRDPRPDEIRRFLRGTS